MAETELGATAQHVFPYSMSTMLEALRQTLDFNVAYDLIEERSEEALFLFRVAQNEDIVRAYVVSLGENRSRVDVCFPSRVKNKTQLCDIFYRNILEQAIAINAFQRKGPLCHQLDYLMRRGIDSVRFKDERPINEFVYFALICNALVMVLGIALIFDEESEDKLSMILVLIAVLWSVSIASFIVTGPKAKQSGRSYAILSLIFSFLITIILIIVIAYAKKEYMF
ncbi:hypothetical protein E5991_01500 [Bifidobacterium pseudolongum]|uniref:Uncharacterized protein n=1 Tax=Bifidobacterium pseudolongum TaxID=1694 RepID=A0A4S4FEP3_9BIFI|nr:hypothetical protein [Bifidobacterium pseudolongum]THG27475.1 hypothetical protein E5991_01500 [Bifidobacterium pseudolongum]